MTKFFQDSVNAAAIAQIVEHYEKFPELFSEHIIESQISDYSKLAAKHWERAFSEILRLNKAAEWESFTYRPGKPDYRADLHLRDGVLALAAYDDASKYLNLSFDKLKMIALLSDSPGAFLLLPTVLAFEKTKA